MGRESWKGGQARVRGPSASGTGSFRTDCLLLKRLKWAHSRVETSSFMGSVKRICEKERSIIGGIMINPLQTALFST